MDTVVFINRKDGLVPLSTLCKESKTLLSSNVRLVSFSYINYPYLSNLGTFNKSVLKLSLFNFVKLAFMFKNSTFTKNCIRLGTYCMYVRHTIQLNSVADPDPGSGIGCLFDPWIRIRDPGSGIGLFRIPDPGSRIPDPGSQLIFLRA